MPGQGARQKSVRRKLSAMEAEFKGKCVLLVDDSIVRGTTSHEIVLMAREAGARKVILASCAPPITHAHIYGIDLASPLELVAHKRTVEEITEHIGADKVIYQKLDNLIASCAEASERPEDPKKFEIGVFCGEYVTGVPQDYFKHLAAVRRSAKMMKDKESAKEAILNGVAGTAELEILQKSINGDEAISEIPASTQANGYATQAIGSSKRNRSSEEEPEKVVRDRQDISLHNYGDETLR